MSDEQGFLARWSRRKRSAAKAAGAQAKPENPGAGAASRAPAALPPPGEAQPLFDPASLPPIESIGAASDIQPFLAAGVPADLMRAALRRAWAADPMIRDFIGLSENSWDFNAPGSMGGFGSLKAEEIHRLLSQAMAEPDAGAAEPPAAVASAADQAGSAPRQDRDTGADRCDPTPRDKTNDNNAAMQHDADGGDSCPVLPRRNHGGALPK